MCIREGCNRTVRGQDDRQACGHLCDFIEEQMKEAMRVCRATGDTDIWAAAVALNDALTEYFDHRKRLYNAALSVGFTREQWRAIKRGN
ncbi:hypothetical protein A5658_16050 [Mycobacterium sp. 1245111.1]|nr:hypothetical protein A5658_16050 [Mycobacterium sp. 1245111.1]